MTATLLSPSRHYLREDPRPICAGSLPRSRSTSLGRKPRPALGPTAGPFPGPQGRARPHPLDPRQPGPPPRAPPHPSPSTAATSAQPPEASPRQLPPPLFPPYLPHNPAHHHRQRGSMRRGSAGPEVVLQSLFTGLKTRCGRGGDRVGTELGGSGATAPGGAGAECGESRRRPTSSSAGRRAHASRAAACRER